MGLHFLPTPVGGSAAARALALAACSLSLACVAPVSEAIGAPQSPSAQPGVAAAPQAESAKLEQCVTSVVGAERSVTFAGEMTAIADTAHMAMRVDIQQRLPGEALFHTLSAPGLGVWRTSEPKVKVYKYLKQVTNLSAPAVYRGLVRFRWLNAKGHMIKHAERLTARCDQPSAPPSRTQSAVGGSLSTPVPPATA
jgi:hypothetical protein